MEKLVRNRTAQIMQVKGEDFPFRIVSGEEYTHFLTAKLTEESEEFVSAKTREDKLKELADVYEVVQALAVDLGYDEFKKTVDEKFTERGGLDAGIVWTAWGR